MKKAFASIILALSITPAMAQHHHHPNYGYRGPSWGWYAAPLVAGAIGYGIARYQQPVIVQPPVVQQPPVYIQQPYCTAWVEVMNPDGSITRSRTCNQ